MSLVQILILVVFLLPLLAVMLGRLRMDIAALMIAGLLALLQYTGFEVMGPTSDTSSAMRALSGFGQSTVVVLVCLFILTAALEKSGFARWITQQILRFGGDSVQRLILLFSGVAAILSMFMNNVAAGALMLPSALEASRRTKIKPSKLLIPVAFGSMLGGMATYFTTANIIASDVLLAVAPDQQPLNILSFLPTGGLIALAGLAFLTLFGDQLLPDKQPAAAGSQLSTGSELEEMYELFERTWRVTIRKNSPLIGQTLREIGLGEKFGLTLAAIQRGKSNFLLPGSSFSVENGDRFFVIGRKERVAELLGLNVQIKLEDRSNSLSKRGLAVFELLVAPRSGAVGKTLKDLNFRQRYGWSVMAMQRGTNRYRTDVGSQRLAVGDSLLVIGGSAQRDVIRRDRNFILLEPSAADQPVLLKETIISLSLLFGSIIAAALGVPIYIALLTGAILLLLTGTLSMQEAYEAIEWQVIFVVGGMYGLSVAMVQTGLAEIAGQWMVRLADAFGPLGLAGGSFLVSSILTQIMGGQVTILVTGPIAISAAVLYGLNPQAVAVATAIGCSNSFLTPMAHAVNLIMVSPGGYEFKDYFRVGRWLFLISFLGLLAGMRLFWNL
jgi:di/tricarboxylate transporter